MSPAAPIRRGWPKGKPRSDPNKPGSDAWAGLDAASTAPGAWNERFAPLRAEMVAIRQFVAATWGSRGYTGSTFRKRVGDD